MEENNKIEPIKIREIGTKGEDASHFIENKIKDSFVIKPDEETIESLELRINEAKQQPLNVVVIGSEFINDKVYLNLIMQKELKATVIIEDIANTKKLAQLPKHKSTVFASHILALSSSTGNQITNTIDKITNPIIIKKSPSYEFFEPIKKHKKRDGGNNRKVNKRKKAKNGKR